MKLAGIIFGVALLLSALVAPAATLTVTVPDGVSTNLILQVSNVYNYAERKKPGETRKEFVERLLAIHLREVYRAIKAEADVKAARAAAQANADAEFPGP